MTTKRRYLSHNLELALDEDGMFYLVVSGDPLHKGFFIGEDPGEFLDAMLRAEVQMTQEDDQ